MDSKNLKEFSKGYMNIAIIKYWCKDKFSPTLIPLVPSISLRSKRFYTLTKIEKSDEDIFILNDEIQSKKETDKVFLFVNKIVKDREKIKIISYNFVPTAAGFASSASAYCALTKQLNKYFNLKLKTADMAKLASIGSGSASRSFYNLASFDTLGNVEKLKTDLNLCMLSIKVSFDKKKISSREAMEISKKTSSIIDIWVSESKKIYVKAKKALIDNDFKTLGKLMEKSTDLMHKTMHLSIPSINYLTEESLKVIKDIKNMRKKGFNIYYTTDAGANVKALYLKEDEKEIIEYLKIKYKGRIKKC